MFEIPLLENPLKPLRHHLNFAHKDLVAKHCGESWVAVWDSCLKPNEVHLILVAAAGGGPCDGLGAAHRLSRLNRPRSPGSC